MGLKTYNPKTRAFVVFNAPQDGDLTVTETLLFNILIELQVISQYLASDRGPIIDEPSTIRTDIVSETA